MASGSADTTVRVWKTSQINDITTTAPLNLQEELLAFDSGSGWIRSTTGALLLWVPPFLRLGVYLPHNTLVISANGTTKLDFSRFVHGTEWVKCYSGINP
ncbi:hypothetical protein DFH06DRAFT_1196396 [Mycena polygramma]|nr:hypothetical protein DFH06DRAFT_1196396 [Mycena polygramma]